MKSNGSQSATKLYTIKEIADFAGVCERTVRRWTKGGLLAAHRINGLVRISEADFRTFLAAHRS